MKVLFYKIKNSDFLTFGELLRLKVSLVLVFLFIFSMLTIPISIFEDFALEVKIIVPTAFAIMFILSFIMLIANRVRLAMHFSIYTFIGLTIYYVTGANLLYGYFMIFITLSIIIFFQDIYTYILYGGALTGYGIYYITVNGNLLVNATESSIILSNLIYQSILLGFFFVFLIHYILSDSMYERLNTEYLKIDKSIEGYRYTCLKYVEEIMERQGTKPLYESIGFQKAVNELAIFINDFYEQRGSNIAEVVEFFFFLHHYDMEQVLKNNKINHITKQYATELEKYIMYRNNDLLAILIDFATQYKTGYDDSDYRYDYHVNQLLSNRTNKLIALALMYRYLRVELTQIDKWGRIERSLAHEEIVDLIQTKEFREFITYEDVTFFLNNQELFERHFR